MSEVLKHGLFAVALQDYGSAFFDWDEYLRRGRVLSFAASRENDP
jgi:hypothetical protein